mmetsp:Transcript_133686/g.303221  ORF Transcript_133686/g.303221 Transcript_133686/m.303221 type:complete len:337 (+) Transcript_133686:575-1585(+)
MPTRRIYNFADGAPLVGSRSHRSSYTEERCCNPRRVFHSISSAPDVASTEKTFWPEKNIWAPFAAVPARLRISNKSGQGAGPVVCNMVACASQQQHFQILRNVMHLETENGPVLCATAGNQLAHCAANQINVESFLHAIGKRNVLRNLGRRVHPWILKVGFHTIFTHRRNPGYSRVLLIPSKPRSPRQLHTQPVGDPGQRRRLGTAAGTQHQLDIRTAVADCYSNVTADSPPEFIERLSQQEFPINHRRKRTHRRCHVWQHQRAFGSHIHTLELELDSMLPPWCGGRAKSELPTSLQVEKEFHRGLLECFKVCKHAGDVSELASHLLSLGPSNRET